MEVTHYSTSSTLPTVDGGDDYCPSTHAPTVKFFASKIPGYRLRPRASPPTVTDPQPVTGSQDPLRPVAPRLEPTPCFTPVGPLRLRGMRVLPSRPLELSQVYGKCGTLITSILPFPAHPLTLWPSTESSRDCAGSLSPPWRISKILS